MVVDEEGQGRKEMNRRHRNENVIGAYVVFKFSETCDGNWYKFPKFLLGKHLYSHSVTYRGDKKGRKGSVIQIL